MKSKIPAIAALLALALALTPALPLLAGPIDYGTGIHLWVLRCQENGQSTAKYVSGAPCPNPPGNCTCERTRHDFPYDHPYGMVRCNIGTVADDPGKVSVTLDWEGAIQCGVTVEPTDGESCGNFYGIEEIDEWDVDWEIRDAVEERLPQVEDETGVPVESVTWGNAYAFE